MIRNLFSGLATSLLLVGYLAPASAQIPLEQGNIESIAEELEYSRPGVRNRSQSRGVVVRYETQLGFDWDGGQDVAGGVQRVTHLEQFTFKFKVPLVNRPNFKALLGYEWDTEKYFFNDPYAGGSGDEQTLFQLLDERRLKANKISAYFTKSWDERFYTTGRVRLSLNGDYEGLIAFDDIYRTYSAAAAFGKKVSDNEEWAVGLTFSSNKARAIALPFFVYNRTFNDRWGIQTALPGQAYLRHNRGRDLQNSFLVGATFDSRYYAINTDERRQFDELEQFFLRNNGIRAMLQYEQNVVPWIWTFARVGYYIPINTRFNPESNIDLDLRTTVGARPFFRIGVFVTPPKEMMERVSR